MRLKILFRYSFLLLFLIFSFQSNCFAQNYEKGIYLKLIGGLNFAADEDFEVGSNSFLESGEASFDAGSLVGLAVGYRFAESFSFEFEYSYRNNDIDEIATNSIRLADGGDLASVALLGNLIFYPSISTLIKPYAGIGLGFLQEIDSDLSLTTGQELTDLEGSAFAWQLLLGFEIPLSQSFGVLAEGRYLSAPGPEISNDIGSFDLDYNNFSFNLGLKYQF